MESSFNQKNQFLNMQRTNIFIASSSEMHYERLELVDLFTDMCSDTMEYIPVKWEYIDSSIHKEHKQSEYMRRLQKCEICIVMFWRSLGEYTEKELLLALEELPKGNNLQKTFILFKEDEEPISLDMAKFKEKCVRQHKDIVHSFSNCQELRELVKRLVLSANIKCNESKWEGKEVKVMIAADEELNEEKLEFTELMAHLNEVLENRGIRLRRVKWTPQGTEEFQKKIYECEMCLNLYWNKLPKKADEEMKAAYDLSTNGTNPQHLYVFFKEPSEGISTALANFKAGFETNYGHFFCKFENADTMNLHFILQFETSHSIITVSNSSINVAGVPFVSITNVPFAAHNESYLQLCSDIEKQKHRLAKYPDDIEEQRDLHLLLVKRQTMEENMLDVARQIYSNSTEQMSSLMIEARRMFEEGELSAVVKILNMDYIISDIQSSKRNIDGLTILKENEKKRISQSINEAQMRIKTEILLHEEGWLQKITNEYILLIDETRYYAAPLDFAYLLLDAARFMEKFNPEPSSIKYYIECINVMESIKQHTPHELSTYGDMLYYAGRFFSDTVYEIDNDPTEGEWMDASNKKTHAEVMKRWRDYRKRAKEYLMKSVDVFESINESNNYDEDIYHSLSCLNKDEIWNGNKKGQKSSFNRTISFVRKSKLSQDFLLSLLCDYAIELFVDKMFDKRNDKEFNAILKECEQIVEVLDPMQLSPDILIAISNLYEMKKDYIQASWYCRNALTKYEKLSEDNPYEYYYQIASCLERLASYISGNTENYKVNPETFLILDRAEEIFNNLYKSTESHVFWNRAGHIKNLRFEFRLKERIDYGAFIFDSILNELKSFFSSHIASGKHIYKISIKDSPIKTIGIMIRKIRNKDEYELFYMWEIDEGSVEQCSMGSFKRGTKEELYKYLLDPDCYNLLKESIIRHLYKSWNMD